jgi:ATP-dependent RNA helicase RhlE
MLVATPGRLTDLVRERDVNLSETTWLVLDEADRMLDMGFINDVRRIAKATHPARQTALFSATMPTRSRTGQQPAARPGPRRGCAPGHAGGRDQAERRHRPHQAEAQLLTMLSDPAMSSVIVFARTKHGADRVTRDLERDGFEAAVIHGNKSQNARQKALNGFRDGRCASWWRPTSPRAASTCPASATCQFRPAGRGGELCAPHRPHRPQRRDGIAITLCDPSENAKLRAVEKIIRMKLAVVADHSGAPPLEAEKRAAQSAGDRSDRSRPASNNRGGRNGQQRPAGNRDWVGKRGPAKPAGEVAARPERAQAKPAGAPAAEGDKSANKPKRKFKPKRNFGNRAPRRAA